MLNWNRHRTVMVEILKNIYETLSIAPSLGFKGGTAAYLFYGLPRYSVDLDFDLLDPEKESLVFGEMEKILSRHGEILEKRVKRYTIFFLLSYGKGERNVKIEISRRHQAGRFTVKNYLGIPMKVMIPEDMFACKLAALADRKKTAMRDFFDTWYFFSQLWEINEETLKKKTGVDLLDWLDKSAEVVEKTDDKFILEGLGELITPKQKDWIKSKLKKELLFQLRSWTDSLRRSERLEKIDFGAPEI